MSHETKAAAHAVDPAEIEEQSIRARLQELQEKQEGAAVQKKRQRDAMRRELVERELVEEYSTLGERGVDYEVLGSPDGFVVVKRGDWIAYKAFMTAKTVNDVPAPEDIIKFAVANLVYPKREKFVEIADKYAGLATRCANTVVHMHQGLGDHGRGK